MIFFLTFLMACGNEKVQDSASPDTWQPDFSCPGQAGCESAEGPLFAGASAVPITPTCFETWKDCGDDGLCVEDEGYPGPDGGENNGKYSRTTEVFLDCGCDRLCPDDPGYTGPDEGEADGKFQAVWLAGFHNSRPATGVHDDLWARTLVVEKGDTTIAFTVVDLIGWFHDDIEKSRQILVNEGVDIDHLMVSATHNHEGPDTMGLWGFTATSGGVDDAYSEYVQSQIVVSVKEALANKREVGEFKVGHVDVADVTRYTANGASNLVRDSRDPVVLDTLFRAAILKDKAGETIATLSHFGNHPEALADENLLITSDFADPLRRSLEDGVVYDSYTRAGYGGVSIYINGAVGGLMTPLGVTVVDGEGSVFPPDYTFERNEAMGKVMAEHAMDALDDAEPVSDMSLVGMSNQFKLPIDNFGFQGMFLANIIDREVYDYDSSIIIDEDNTPKVLTEVGHFQLGPMTLTTVPGEIVPELLIGGFDGSKVGDPNKTLIDENNPNPPDLSLAPEGPFIQELIGGEHAWIVGLGYDELGYILPEYDFKLDDVSPWFDQAPGDHYEETNSLGPQTYGLIKEQIEMLLDYASK